MGDRRVEIREYGDAEATVLKSEQELRRYLRIKRVQDVMLSVLALVMLFPLMLVIAILVVVDDPKGGPIFSQERVGKNGRLFRMYKFRTMCVDAEKRQAELDQYNEMDRVVFKIKKDPRITRAGHFLRKTSLDELPQLVNILKGNMSIVGPRPPLPREVEQYTWYEWQRLQVTPGLTCYWQVHPNRYKLSLNEWVSLDVKYIQERSWRLDWRLIWLTVKRVLQADGE